MKKVMKVIAKVLLKLVLALCALFAVTFAVYMLNLENKLIYYVVRPFLNKHYDSQVRNRKI